MKDKEEQKKQVIILASILVIVIIVAIVLNMNNANNIKKTTSVKGKTIQNTNIETNEMINNLKGLIEEQKDEEKLNTDEATTVNTSSEETVKILETDYD